MGLWDRKSSAAPTPPTFDGSSSSAASSPAAPSVDELERARQAKLAMYELKGVTDLFNRMSHMCWEKCVAPNKFGDAELTVGELACDDRCVVKYMAAQTLIGQVLNQNFMNPQGGAGLPAPPK